MNKNKDFNWREELDYTWDNFDDEGFHDTDKGDIVKLIEKVESSTIDKVKEMVKTGKDPYMLKKTEKRFLENLKKLDNE